MKFPVSLLAALALVACETPTTSTRPAQTGGLRPPGPAKPVTFSGGNGSSYKTAIVVHASDEKSGVHSEYEYIRAHYPGAQFRGQVLALENGKSYDVMTFLDGSGKKRVLYFDIGEYFGRI